MSTTVEILSYRLPTRMAELNTFIVLASSLEANAPNSVEIKMASDLYFVSNARLLLDVVSDGAVVIARTLLQFLGLSYQKATATSPATLGVMNWRKDDIKITDLTLPPVTPVVATNGWPEGQQRCEQLLKLCFETGDKVSAHFTTKNASVQNATISELRDAFELVIRLVNRSVYKPSGRADVVFSVGGNFGHIVLKQDAISL